MKLPKYITFRNIEYTARDENIKLVVLWYDCIRREYSSKFNKDDIINVICLILCRDQYNKKYKPYVSSKIAHLAMW